MKMSTYRETQAAWARIWREEADLARELGTLGYARARRARALYLPQLPWDGLILEAGCGMGINLVQLREEGYRVAGVDYATAALRPLQRSQLGHLLAVGDIHDLPYPDGAFGAYLSFGVLEHTEFGPGPALEEARRVLRPGGILVLSVPYPNLVWQISRIRRRLRRASTPAKPLYYETAYTAHALGDLVQQAGFAIIARHPIGHSFTLWGIGRPFRGRGYYETTAAAERLGEVLRRLAPWAMCFESLIIARREDFQD
jgi:SAM-dependent methyltransferase